MLKPNSGTYVSTTSSTSRIGSPRGSREVLLRLLWRCVSEIGSWVERVCVCEFYVNVLIWNCRERELEGDCGRVDGVGVGVKIVAQSRTGVL